MPQGNGISFYYNSDIGYSSHFREILNLFRVPDYVSLGIRAYKPRWSIRPNHIPLYESLTAAEEMCAELTIPTHYGISDLFDESLRDLLKVFTAEAKRRKILVRIFYLGEIVKSNKQR